MAIVNRAGVLPTRTMPAAARTCALSLLIAGAAAGQPAPDQTPSQPHVAESAADAHPAVDGGGPSLEADDSPEAIAAPADRDTDPLPPTTIEAELERMRPGSVLKRKFDEIAAETNLRLGFASTFLFQQASGGPGERTTGAGDIDLLAKWTAIGAGTKDTGILAFAGEYRFQLAETTPSALGGQIGTLVPTTNGFSERPPVVKELYWDQRLFDDRFRFAIGRIDPENLFGAHRLQSANLFFLNKAFSGNPAVAYPGSGFAAAAQVKPVPWLYVTAGVTDANGKVTTSNIDGFFNNGEFFSFLEGAITPTFEGIGSGRYRLSVWHIDARDGAGAPEDQGVTLSLDQDFGEAITAFARYGHADGEVTGVAHTVQGGLGIRGVIGQEHMLGIAAAWSDPAQSGLRDEKVLEVFQRFQVTEVAQLTLGAQAIFDPSNAPDDHLLGVFSIRLRIAF